MQKLIIANWKMFYGPIKAGAWIRAFRRERLPKDLEIVVSVPHVSLAAARASLGRASVPLLGAQDVFWMEDGPFTGEISPGMLKEFGISYCLVGHSERRANLGETDEMVAKKAAALQKAGIHPVICVGETEAQRRRGEALKVVRAQLTEALSAVKADGTPIVVAYEPVWAIGTGKSCSSEDAKEVHEAIRALLVKKLGKTGETVPILYGGSVDVRNVVEFLSTTHIDGVLVGSASLDPRNFGLLCRTALPA
jgi:triosephosphate isomerase